MCSQSIVGAELCPNSFARSFQNRTRASRATAAGVVLGGHAKSATCGGTPAATSAPRKQSTNVMFGSVDSGVLYA
jgi:hypothetical protein